MLRITRFEENRSQLRLKLEGRIISNWVHILREECQNIAQTYSTVELDLADISFIDSLGAKILKELQSNGFHLINCSPLVKDIINENADHNRD